jgi:hypothetical protein
MPRHARPLPDDLNGEFQKAALDVGHILAHQTAEVLRLVGAFAEIQPSTGAISFREAEEWALSRGLSVDDVLALLRLAQFVSFTVPDDERTVEKVSDGILKHLGKPGSRSDLHAFLDKFLPAAEALEQRMAEAGDLSSCMPSFSDCEIVCDLRFNAKSERKTLPSFATVAIVRVELDEGKPLVFQCNRPALSRLASKVEEAVRTLSELEKLSKDRLKLD